MPTIVLGGPRSGISILAVKMEVDKSGSSSTVLINILNFCCYCIVYRLQQIGEYRTGQAAGQLCK